MAVSKFFSSSFLMISNDIHDLGVQMTDRSLNFEHVWTKSTLNPGLKKFQAVDDVYQGRKAGSFFLLGATPWWGWSKRKDEVGLQGAEKLCQSCWSSFIIIMNYHEWLLHYQLLPSIVTKIITDRFVADLHSSRVLVSKHFCRFAEMLFNLLI